MATHPTSFADERALSSCVYCGGLTGTRDHVPSKVLLDQPYPDDLPVVPACVECNNSFSKAEEYLACLVDVERAGTVEPSLAHRPRIARILCERPALAARLKAARQLLDDGFVFTVEHERVEQVMLKLARGHAAFELNEPQYEPPAAFWASPLHLLTREARSAFETWEAPDIWPEVGCRAMQRLLAKIGSGGDGWVTVQPERYRYLVAWGPPTIIRMVLSELIACEVTWE
jgi:hypothetical protein